MSAKEVHHFKIKGGWQIALSRVSPGRASQERKSAKLPILLVHGLSSNALSFDFDPRCSLMEELAAQGWDLWALDLRGHGKSEKPKLPQLGRYNWNFDDYLEHEIPGAIQLVRGVTGARRVHWIGHSMGGVLLYAYLSMGKGQEELQSGVTLGASLDYSTTPNDFKNFSRFTRLASAIPAFPVGLAAKLYSPFAGWTDNAVERFNYWPANTEPRIARKIHRDLFHGVSTKVLLQLHTALEPGGLKAMSGASYQEGLGKAKLPILAIAGDRDRQCPEDAVRDSFERLGSQDKKLLVFGRASGQMNHYGHMDLLIGKNAAKEVYPAISDWLSRH